ncbi:MAG: TFIIB-type zinc ribbon-containing protein [Planctomycetota bacterium]
MLVKCVCANCGHSFLTDDQAGDLTCPRCGYVNDNASGGGFPVEPAPDHGALPPEFQPEPEFNHGAPEPAFAPPSGFDPKSPPPLFMSWDRMFRGMFFGGILTLSLGAALGAALAATGLVIPGVAALLMALGAGAATRHGLGGRTALRTRGFAISAIIVVVLVGYLGIIGGSWMVERFTGTRAAQTREDLSAGKVQLASQLARARKMTDVKSAAILEAKFEQAEKLEKLTDAQIEDYLWTQQAQFNQPLVAYAKVKLTQGDLLKLGADKPPVRAPKHAPIAIAGVELLLAMLIAYQGVKSKR